MSIFLGSARRFWLPGINNVRSDYLLSMSSWLDSSTYYVNSVQDAGRFTLQFGDPSHVAKLFAVTADRTATSCCESIASVAEVARSPRSVAWLLIKLYYASFFAAHCHLRTCGQSCANIDALDSAKIFDAAKLYGALGSVTKINSGQYFIEYSAQSQEMKFSSLGSMGSHEALWSSYKNFLVQLEQLSSSQIPIVAERKMFVEHLRNLRKTLCLNGFNGGNWLSRFRNQLQYRQGYGAWYPYTLSKSVTSSMYDKVLSTFMGDPDNIVLSAHAKGIEEEVKAFFSSTMFLSSFTRAAALELARRSENKNAVARQGAANFLRRAKFN